MKCDTCRHLDRDGDDNVCRRITQDFDSAFIYVKAGEPVLVVTPKEFGCILHEPIP